MFYGLDVHKEFLQVCALGDDGRERKDFRVGGHPEAIETFARGFARSDQIALEAAFHSWAIVQILRRHVDGVVVADPAQPKAIATARIKTDKVDARSSRSSCGSTSSSRSSSRRARPRAASS